MEVVPLLLETEGRERIYLIHLATRTATECYIVSSFHFRAHSQSPMPIEFTKLTITYIHTDLEHLLNMVRIFLLLPVPSFPTSSHPSQPDSLCQNEIRPLYARGNTVHFARLRPQGHVRSTASLYCICLSILDISRTTGGGQQQGTRLFEASNIRNMKGSTNNFTGS